MNSTGSSHKPQHGASGTITREIKITLLQALKRGFIDEAAKELLQACLFGCGQSFKVEITEAKWEIERLETLHSLLSEDDACKKEKEIAAALRAMGYEVRKKAYHERCKENPQIQAEFENRKINH